MAGYFSKESLTALQTRYTQRIPPEDIPHGASVPVDTIHSFLPDGGLLMDFGSGTGEKAALLSHAGYGVTGIEINENAVVYAEKTYDVVSLPGDVRNFWNTEINLAAIVYIEKAGGVLLQGLLANILTTSDIRRVLRTVDIALRPGGFVFIAEPVRYDTIHVHDSKISDELRSWQHRWRERYIRNFQAGLPWGAFTVAKPGKDKDHYDWELSAGEIRELIKSSHSDPQSPMERFARHISIGLVDNSLRGLEYRCVHLEPTIMYSRTREPLVGAIGVWQKVHGLSGEKHAYSYKYDPYYKGMTLDERHAGMRAKIVGSPYEKNDLISRLRRNFPSSHQPPPSYTLR